LSDDEVFDSDHDFFDCPPCKLFYVIYRFILKLFYNVKVPTACQTEVESSESFYKCFIRRYHACPAFFMGSLQKACESAFNSSVVEEVRFKSIFIRTNNCIFILASPDTCLHSS